MPEFNLLEHAGLSQKKKRQRGEATKPEDKKIAEKLDFSFYDGDRSKGYGGYYYDGRWRAVAEKIKERYNLTEKSKVLIDRCHKGFLVYDLKKLIPGIIIYGIHPSEYPINHAMEGYGRWALINKVESGDPNIIEEKAKAEITPLLINGESDNLPFKNDFFDCVISIENACAYPESECRQVIKEIIRVSRNNGEKCYIQNDSWTNDNERQKLTDWTLLCKTFLDMIGWERLFKEVNYNGDWGFTIIQ